MTDEKRHRDLLQQVRRRDDEIERLRKALRDIIDLAQAMDGLGYCDEEEYEQTIKLAKEALGE